MPPMPAVSTGLTPHVGTLELPPGIEGIVPTNMPLTGARAGALACLRAFGGDEATASQLERGSLCLPCCAMLQPALPSSP